jgi:protein-tyrosine phosphatase
MKVRVIWKSGTDEANAPPQALIDIRSHLLWGLDDGPANIDRSLAMLQAAAAHGTTDIVAAPSASFEHVFDPELAAQRLEELRARSDGSIRIHSGCDFHFAYGNIRDALANPHKYAINGLNHLLIEFAGTSIPPATDEILGKFRKQGVIPVIAHPERNPILQCSIERLKHWIAMGCVLQVTARSLSGHFGKTEQSFAWDLLREGWVYVIASDARDLLHHPPRLDGAWRMLKQELGEDVAKKLLIDNPSLILQGRAQRKPAQPVTFIPRPVAAGEQPR